MKTIKQLFRIYLPVLLGIVTACQNEQLPSNPTLSLPITGLVISVNGEDCTATPRLLAQGALNDTLFLAVKIPATSGLIKQISFRDNNVSSPMRVGEQINFADNCFNLPLNDNGAQKNYVVKMSYNPPPFLYFIKSSDKDTEGVRYFLDESKADRIASVNYDHLFEGYIDLTATDWDNVGLVESSKANYFDSGEGWSGLSYGILTLVSNPSPGNNHFPCDGPWNDWLYTGGNSKIVSPGVWKCNFNSDTKEITLQETQWAVGGTALSSPQPLIYHSAQKEWRATLSLAVGAFRFVNLPVSTGDPQFTLGTSSTTSNLDYDGGAISVEQAGTYNVILNLSNPPYYTYSFIQQP